MSTAEQKKEKRRQAAADKAAAEVKAAGGDQAAQDAAAAAAGTAADGATASTGDQGDSSDGDDLSDDDKAELKEAARLDAERLKTKAKSVLVGRRPIKAEQKGIDTPAAISLLLDACERFGVNPYADQKPIELLSWAYYPGADDAAALTPDAVVIVTGGGVKLKHWDDPDYPLDVDTKERLDRIFHRNQLDPTSKQPVVLPLADDLTLPAAAVTGAVTSTDHQYQGGYVKSGGREAAKEKEKRRADRLKRHGL